MDVRGKRPDCPNITIHIPCNRVKKAGEDYVKQKNNSWSENILLFEVISYLLNFGSCLSNICFVFSIGRNLIYVIRRSIRIGGYFIE